MPAVESPEIVRVGDGRTRVTFRYRDPTAERVALARGASGLDPTDPYLRRDGEWWTREFECRSDLRTVYQFQIGDDDVRADPLNPRTYIFPADPEAGEEETVASVLELPDAQPLRWSVERDVPHGTLELHRLRSDILGNERRVWRYTPPGGEPEGLLLLFDGFAFTTLAPAPVVLDNLIADNRIPRLAVVLPDSLDAETRLREMVCNRDFVRFVTEELLPWAGVSAERKLTVAGGSSVGGLAAAFAAVERPDIFGAVLSMSGSFQRGRLGGEPGYLMSRLAEQTPLPIRWYLDAGVLELRVVEGRESNLHANRHLRDVLVAKGYEVHHREFPGWHDYLWWRETMADGLVALVGRQT